MASAAANSGGAPARIPYPNPGWARGVSLALAGIMSLLFYTHSQSIATLVTDHGAWLLALLMWSCAIGFIHGVGFVPRHALWRILFSPFIGWPLTLLGIALVLSGN